MELRTAERGTKERALRERELKSSREPRELRES